MPKYPIYLDLSGKRVVVIGAGAIAARKVCALAEAQARVVVVAPQIDSVFQQTCRMDNVELIVSAYSMDYLAGAVLCIAGTNDNELNRRIYADCRQLEVLCNVVDVPDLCDFYVPAVLSRGPLQIAIGTDGNCPAYAGHIRRKLEDIFTETHGRFVEALEKVRQKIISEIPDQNRKKSIMGKLVTDQSLEYFTTHGPEAWRDYAGQIVRES